MPRTKEDFIMPEGGLFDDFDGKVIDAYFGPSTGKYAQASGSAEPGLWLVFENPEADKPFPQFFTIGKGWEIGTSNKEIVNINKPEMELFIRSSKVGKVIDRVAELIGEGDIDKGREYFAKKDMPMINANFYIGWNAHWKNEESEITVEGSKKTVKTLLPNKWYGAEEVKAGAKAKAPEATADTKALDDLVIKMAAGKTERELKQAILKDTPENKSIKDNKVYMTGVVSGIVLKRLETEGKLFKGEGDKFVAI